MSSAASSSSSSVFGTTISIPSQYKTHIVFDLETTGLPCRKGVFGVYDYKRTDKYDSARIVQIGYIVYSNSEENKQLKSVERIIKPEKFLIPNSDIHGIDEERAYKEGISFEAAMTEFSKDLETCDTLISHNIDFDINVLKSELHRRRYKSILEQVKKIQCKCTMKMAMEKKICSKRPKLIDLYTKLVEGDPPGKIHTALVDALMCAEVYHRLCDSSPSSTS